MSVLEPQSQMPVLHDNSTDDLLWQTALRTIRVEFKLGSDIPNEHIMLGVKCAVNGGSKFLFVGSSEWSGIAREIKHILVVVQALGQGKHIICLFLCLWL